MTHASYERRSAGELGTAVMVALWDAGAPLMPGRVRSELGFGLARMTVATTLARLYEKGVVSRGRQGRGYVYLPVEDAPGLTARRMHTELDRDTDRETVLARFVAQLSSGDERLLRRLLDRDGR